MDNASILDKTKIKIIAAATISRGFSLKKRRS